MASAGGRGAGLRRLASAPAGAASGGRFSGAGSGVGAAAADSASGAARLGLVLAVELQAEAHRRVDEGRSAANGTLMRSCCLLKLTVTAKLRRRDGLQVPVLVLEHDRHLFRVLARADGSGSSTPGMVAAEGDVEMVRAGQAFFGDMRQRAAHDAAQRIVDESVVGKRSFMACRTFMNPSVPLP